MAKDYISRDEMIEQTKARIVLGAPRFNTGLEAAIEVATSIPVADVVEVVRCRECAFWDTSWNPGVGVTGEAHYCPRCHLVTLKDSFCSGACRKDGGQDYAG